MLDAGPQVHVSPPSYYYLSLLDAAFVCVCVYGCVVNISYLTTDGQLTNLSRYLVSLHICDLKGGGSP